MQRTISKIDEISKTIAEISIALLAYQAPIKPDAQHQLNTINLFRKLQELILGCKKIDIHTHKAINGLNDLIGPFSLTLQNNNNQPAMIVLGDIRTSIYQTLITLSDKKTPNQLISLMILHSNLSIQAGIQASIGDLSTAMKNFKLCDQYLEEIKKSKHRHPAIPELLAMYFYISLPVKARIAVKRRDIYHAKKYTAIATNFYYTIKEVGDKFIAADELRKSYSEIGMILFKSKDFKQAIYYFKLSIEMCLELKKCLDPSKPTFNYNIGKNRSLDEFSLVNVAEMIKTTDKSITTIELFIKKSQAAVFNNQCDKFKDLLKRQNVIAECISDEINHIAQIRFKDVTHTAMMRNALERSKVFYTMSKEGGICIKIVDIGMKYLSYAVDAFLQISAASSMPIAANEKSPNQANEKDAKKQRHVEKEALRQKEATLPAPIAPVETGKEKVEKTREIVWDNKQYKNLTPIDPAYKQRIFGSRYLRTFYQFDATEIAKIKSVDTIKKFKESVKNGRAYGSGNSENKQGPVFFKDDKELKKYGKEYVCKIKVKGEFGNHRFLGRKVTTGHKLVNGKIKDNQCELIIFDKYVDKAHRKT